MVKCQYCGIKLPKPDIDINELALFCTILPSITAIFVGILSQNFAYLIAGALLGLVIGALESVSIHITRTNPHKPQHRCREQIDAQMARRARALTMLIVAPKPEPAAPIEKPEDLDRAKSMVDKLET